MSWKPTRGNISPSHYKHEIQGNIKQQSKINITGVGENITPIVEEKRAQFSKKTQGFFFLSYRARENFSKGQK